MAPSLLSLEFLLRCHLLGQTSLTTTFNITHPTSMPLTRPCFSQKPSIDFSASNSYHPQLQPTLFCTPALRDFT